jgi:hypothetical protein
MFAVVTVIAVGNAPVASFDKEIAAEALILEFEITPSFIALAVTASTANSFDVIPLVATFILPETNESVVLPSAIAWGVNVVSSMMLFINVLVITSLVANVLVVSTTPAILELGNDLSVCHGTRDLNRSDLRGTDCPCQG